MLKVVAVSDKKGTAIDRLCWGVAKYHDNLNYTVCDVHPKRPDQRQLDEFYEAAKLADIIDYQYYRTADMLRDRFPELRKKKSILTHNNPYSIHERNWDDYDVVVANNQTMEKDLSEITHSRLTYIPLVQDIEFFTFKREFEKNKNIIMVANRIEGKKGILPVALACQELGLKLILVGAISDVKYMESIMATNVVEFHENITNDELLELYHRATIHICNSVDDFESGTLPILEAMMTGVPVITRWIGHVPDIQEKDNMIINKGDNENIEYLIRLIEDLITDNKKMLEMRDKAWNSVKSRNFDRRAYSYQQLYRSLISEQTPVSIIVPIADNEDITRECLNAIAKQDYTNIEVVITDDGQNYQSAIIDDFAKTVNYPVRYIESYKGDYGLARARNIGICESTGNIIVFCDQRIIMESSAVTKLVANLNKRQWVFGNKNGKKNFVENFSAIFKEDIVRMGMFNERVTEYGGMSQEIRTRANICGIETKYVADAKATPKGSSKNKHLKRREIVHMKNLLWKLGL